MIRTNSGRTGNEELRVLHVIDALGVGGGAEHSLAVLLPALRERGIDSTVVTLSPSTMGIADQLRSDGFDVLALTRTSRRGRVQQLRTLLDSQRPSVVHATLFESSLVARLARGRSGPPLVNSIVNTSYDTVRTTFIGGGRWKLAAMAGIDRLTIGLYVDHVHAITQAVATEVVRVLRVPPDKISVIPRGRARSQLGRRSSGRRREIRAALGFDDDRTVLLNVARQDHQKAQVTLVEAFAKLKLVEAHLLIAGRPGAATPAIEAAIERHGLDERVTLLGDRPDVPDLMVAADLFVFPSLYEGLGCAVIEAMGLGLPVVASDAPALVEVLQAGDAGRLARRGDAQALAAAVEEALAKPAETAAMARRAEAHFDARFELSAVADSTAAMYRQVWDQHGAKRCSPRATETRSFSA